MESLPEIDLVHSSPSELLAPPLNITIQQNVNGDNNSSSTQEPMETIPVEQIDHKNAKSQKKIQILLLPLGDCENSYYHAVAKKGYSYNELLFIISHLISILTKK